MKKLTFGEPELFTPTFFCKTLRAEETEISYPAGKIKFQITGRGCLLELPITEDEQVYGFGLQLKRLNHKSRKRTIRANADPRADSGDTHAPVPFFITNKGYGVYVDTARYVDFYCGYRKPRQDGSMVMTIDIPVARGVDVYIFEGKNITEIVSRYNMFAGGGCEIPEWGFGVMYRCNGKYNEEQVLSMAKYLHEAEIPCDILGLEPGWQSYAYSSSYTWNQGNYPHYKDVIRQLREMDFHVNLWEQAYISQYSPLYEKIIPYSGDYLVWNGIVPDFSIPKARQIFAAYHRENLISLGVDGFKLDECDGSDYTGGWGFPNCTAFPSGLDGELYHNLFGVLYQQTILEALDGTPTFSLVRSSGSLAAPYPFALYSDLYDHQDFVRAMLNAGFSGLLWTPELRGAKDKKELLRRLQTLVFSVFCVINAWNMKDAPWLLFDCENEARELLKIRGSLAPMLKRAFAEYKASGKPPIRALVSDYTGDSETWNIDDQYIFCDDLIVAPITTEEGERRVYLPEGKWRDYWTKEERAPGWFEIHTEKIPVFEKSIGN